MQVQIMSPAAHRFQLKRWGMRIKPRKSHQEMIVEAIRTYLSQDEG